MYKESEAVGSNDWIPVAGVETDTRLTTEQSEALKHRVIAAILSSHKEVPEDMFM